MAERPPDFVLVFALALHGGSGIGDSPPRLAADEVAHVLRSKFGLDFTAQQVGSWLGRLARQDLPPVEAEEAEGFHFYRLTRWGKTELLNETQAFRRVLRLQVVGFAGGRAA
jgi:hypothetical protein